MGSKLRWKQAQSYERGYWQNTENKAKQGSVDLTWYKWRADNLQRLFDTAFAQKKRSFESSRILEVGCGPVGVISFFNAMERYAVDPLNDFFESLPELTKHRNANVKYKTSMGEKLPFEDKFFDLVIIENVIDHVSNSGSVMKEINRVLKDKSTLYLTVNLHPGWGAFLHTIVSKLRIDKGHPHTFTIPRIRGFLKAHGFNLIYEEWEDYRECRKKDLESKSRKALIKGISGLSEFLYSSISNK